MCQVCPEGILVLSDLLDSMPVLSKNRNLIFLLFSKNDYIRHKHEALLVLSNTRDSFSNKHIFSVLKKNAKTRDYIASKLR